MNAVANLASRAVAPMEVSIKGRVEAVRRFEQFTFTRLITPAADQYSRPAVIEVRSAARIGQRGDEVSITARLGGYQRKPYKVTDKETGEISMVVPVDMTLDLVE